jgi:hypothetical protein
VRFAVVDEIAAAADGGGEEGLEVEVESADENHRLVIVVFVEIDGVAVRNDGAGGESAESAEGGRRLGQEDRRIGGYENG